ncbi:histidinol-phosphatase [Shewanella oncorhynchi]|uniref:histidinol-phosphatase n=1 Tax=Shewanella oncorhynchi TaxID=2726434 RepID=UPI003D79347D
MIDSHCHTFYSKHAVGTVDELVQASIAAGVTVLTITDHAPFPIDKDNRLVESELERYFADIDKAQENYKGEITLLRGLELDFILGSEVYTSRLLQNYPLDFVLGSIHYVTAKDDSMIKVWDLPRLKNTDFLDRYFASIESLIECGLFDAVGHVDCLLRGISEDEFLFRAERLLPAIVRSGIAYELNSSGLRKSIFNSESDKELMGVWSYPSRIFVTKLLALDVPFTVGSDVHTPADAGAGITELIEALKPTGLHEISYFVQRQRIDVALDKLQLAVNSGLVKEGFL